VVVVQSAFGHDGFLIETEQIGSVIGSALRE
jgi:homoserine acetyltransferase